MAKLTITGKRKYLDMIIKDNRSRSAKYGLEFSLDAPKAKEKAPEPAKDAEPVQDPAADKDASTATDTKKAPKAKSKSKKTK